MFLDESSDEEYNDQSNGSVDVTKDEVDDNISDDDDENDEENDDDTIKNNNMSWKEDITSKAKKAYLERQTNTENLMKLVYGVFSMVNIFNK